MKFMGIACMNLDYTVRDGAVPPPHTAPPVVTATES
jgi:hypothetical protein